MGEGPSFGATLATERHNYLNSGKTNETTKTLTQATLLKSPICLSLLVVGSRW
jgi:hypothetical protein